MDYICYLLSFQAVVSVTHAFCWACYKAEDSLKNGLFNLYHCPYIPVLHNT